MMDWKERLEWIFSLPVCVFHEMPFSSSNLLFIFLFSLFPITNYVVIIIISASKNVKNKQEGIAEKQENNNNKDDDCGGKENPSALVVNFI